MSPRVPIPSVSPSQGTTRAISVAAMQAIETIAIHTLGIPRLLLMDHAGLAIAQAVRQLVPSPAASIALVCGSGYNGGDGLCAAWQLARWGYHPHVVLASPLERLPEEPAVFARVVQALNIPLDVVQTSDDVERCRAVLARSEAIVDALLGIGVRGTIAPVYASLIQLMNESGKPIIAADVPSGLDADTGMPHGAVVRATVTVTFGLLKQGLLAAEGPSHAGRVIVDDIGLPQHLLATA